MGKSKGAQRTKGNARPSSSGHSAELMGPDGKVGFVGFSSSKSGQHVAQNSDYNVDGMFAVVMKKMLKRDVTTKLKAVQEFRDLCITKDKEVVLEVVPYWPRLFNKCALDSDRRIREATQEANTKLFEKVKRDFAPYLRNIMGVWLLSQNDLHSPVASLSRATFNSTFPKDKQSEALMFCKEEVFSYFKDNLFEQTPESLSEPNAPPEEVEQKYILVICGTLAGLKQFIRTISASSKKAVIKDVKAIISPDRFWKFAKYKNPQIRVAWYNLVSCILHNMPAVFQDFGAKLGRAILGCLSESDAIIAPAIWEAALYYVAGFENCWDSLDVNKVVLPELLKLLKEGGRGNAHLLFPCLLPFISKFPIDVTRKRNNFFPLLFFSIIESLFLDDVKSSPSECNAIISAYIECLSFVCVQLGKEEEWSSVMEELILCQLISLTERSFTAEGTHMPFTKFYPLLGTFLQTLENNSLQESGFASSMLRKLLGVFYQRVFNICAEVLTTDHLPQNADLVFMAYFFHCLYGPTNFLDKKKTKVKFLNDPSARCAKLLPKITRLESPVPPASQRSQLFACTVRVSRLLLRTLETELEPHYLKLFVEILSSARCSMLFQELMPAEDSSDLSEMESPQVFFEEFAVPWMERAGKEEAQLGNIVGLVYVICSCVKEDTALKILNYCCQVDNLEFVKKLLQQGMSSYWNDKLFCKWLKSPEAGKSALNLFTQTVHVNCPGYKQIVDIKKLKSHFSALHDGLFQASGKKLLIDEKFHEKLLCIISERIDALRDQDSPLKPADLEVLEFLCCTAENIFSSYEESWMLPVASKILKTFLEIYLCHIQTFNDNLQEKLSKMWKLGVRRLSAIQYNLEPEKQFVPSVAKCFHKLLTQPQDREICDRFHKCVLMMMNELRDTYVSVEESDEIVDQKLFSVLEEIFPTDLEWVEMRKKMRLALRPAFLEMKLFDPLPEEKILPVGPVSAPGHEAAVRNTSNVLLKCTSFEDLDDLMPVFIDIVAKQLPHLLWALSYYEQNGLLDNEDADSDDENDDRNLHKKCFKILSFLPQEDALDFLDRLVEMSEDRCPNPWILPFEKAIQMMKLIRPLDMSEIYELYMYLSFDENPAKQQMSQTVVQYLPSGLKADILLLFVEPFCQSLTHPPGQVLFVKHVSSRTVPNITIRRRKFLSKTTRVEEGNSVVQQLMKHECTSLDALSKICCCARDIAILCDAVVQDALVDVILEAIEFIKVERLKGFEAVFGMSCQLYCLVIQIMKNCPKVLVRLWAPILDFVCISLLRCDQHKNILITEAAELVHAHHCSTMVCNLLSLMSRCTEFSEHNISQQNPDFMSDVTNALVNLFLDISAQEKKVKEFPQPVADLLATITVSMEFLPSELMLNSVWPKSVETPGTVLVENLLKDRLLPFLTSDVFPIQLGVHTILMKILSMFPALLNTEDEKLDCIENKFKRLQPLTKILESTTQIVESMLSHLKVNQCCYVLPGSDSYVYTLAFLYGWSELLEFFASSTDQERSAYSAFLATENHLMTFLSCLFRLLPENPASLTTIRNPNARDVLKSVFTEPPRFSASDKPSAMFVQHVACNTYYQALRRLPAAVRSWGHSLDSKSYEAVNKFTSRYVSSIVAAKEIQSLHENSQRLTKRTPENMTVQACPGSREVIAMYTVDSSTIELIIQLPPDFPFGPINIEKRGNVKLSQNKWRLWLKQLTAFLTYQNGSILDGLLLWKKNLDKTFEGIEECLICYFILHSTSLELPQKSCPTCKKKFHASCIHKWFVTSNNATCPLCRNYW